MKLQPSLLLTLALLPWSRAEDVRFFRLNSPVSSSITAFNREGYMTWSNLVANGTIIVQTTVSPASSNWVTYVQVPVTNTITVHWLVDPNPPAGMVLIPAGIFPMGDTFGDNGTADGPLHTNNVSAFYMDKFEVTKAMWDDVSAWGTSHGYIFQFGAAGKASTHPAQNMTWYDAALWCNARSEKEGRTPAYYTSSQLTNVYRNGQTNVQNDWVKWTTGYRLPTEAEWEKAARGGPAGHRFPWSDADTITHSRANYVSATNYSYDISPTRGNHPTFSNNPAPFTSPVGSFAPNGYGVYDTAGNVWEWCWDWYAPYPTNSATTDPRGPLSGQYRVYRGGSWVSFASESRVANHYYFNATGRANNIGFRSVLPPGS